MKTALTDFSIEELKDAYVAISIVEIKTRDPKVRENLQLWQAQLIQASQKVKEMETVTNN